MPVLELLTLHCIETEDVTGPDEPKLEVWGTGFHVFTKGSLNDNETWEIGEAVRFEARAKVRLWDRDSPDDDDLIGTHVIRDDEPRNQELTKAFTEGANYELTYRVLDDFRSVGPPVSGDMPRKS